MPSYELALIIKSSLQRTELAHVLKRMCQSIIEKDGIIRNVENLGCLTLPYKMSSHGERHQQGNYFIFNMDTPVESIEKLKDQLSRDVDIIRPNILRKIEEFSPPCEKGPCQFGELINPDHKRKAWRKKVLKNLKIKQKGNELQ